MKPGPKKKARDPVSVLLVDGSAIVRSGLIAILSAPAHPPIVVVGEAASAAEAVREARRLRPRVVLLEAKLPDGPGSAVCRQILRQLPETQILMLTGFSSDDLVYEAVRAGAKGFLSKEISPPDLLEAIGGAAAGRSVLSPDVTARVLQMLRKGERERVAVLDLLSPQERRVLALVADGRTNKEIGSRLRLSENTVKNYLVSVFEKLKVKRRSQAAALYVQSAGGAKAGDDHRG